MPQAGAPKVEYEVNEKVLVEYYGAWYEAKILKMQVEENIPYYHVHYMGWNKTRDEWVVSDNIKKHNEENMKMALESQAQVQQEASKHVRKRALPNTGGRKSANSEEIDSGSTCGKQKTESGSEQDGSINGAAEQQQKRAQQRLREQMIQPPKKKLEGDKLNIPEKLQRILYWDFLSKSHSDETIRIPTVGCSIEKVLQGYVTHVEVKKGNSADARDICTGLKELFNETVQHQLLLVSERSQLKKFLSEKQQRQESLPEMTEIFDGWYLLRLFSKIGPQLRKEFAGSDLHFLHKELQKFLLFLTNNSEKYFGTVV